MPKSLSAVARFVLSGRRRSATARSSQTSTSSPAPLPAEPLESRTYFAVTQNADGWTVVTPESGSQVIYVSSSQGSDGNTGRSSDRPVKTLDRAESLVRDNSGDQLLLKRGDVWRGQTFDGWSESGRNDDEPIVIGAYGSGARPRLDTGAETAFYAGGGQRVDHVSLIGLHLSAHTRLPGPSFTGTDGAPGINLLAPTDDFLVEDCFIQGYADNILLQDFFGALTDVRIRRSVIVDAYRTGGHAQGLYAQGVDGLLLEDNVFDHNGWIENLPGGGGNPTAFNHNAYLRSDNTGVVARGNVFSHASSHGLQARAGGVIENNLFIGNPVAMTFGLVNGSPATAGGVTGRVTGNVYVGGGDTYRKINGQTLGWAMDVGNVRPGAGATISDNVFAGDGGGVFPAIILAVGANLENRDQTAGLNDLTISRNVIHHFAEGIRISPTLKPGQSGPDGLNGLAVRDNDFQRLGGRAILHDAPFVDGAETWSGNRYDGGSDGKPDVLEKFFEMPWDRWKRDREPTARVTRVRYPSPDRTPATYAGSLGGAASADALVAEMRKLSSQNARPSYTPEAVARYIRAGFVEGGTATPTPTTPTPTTPTPTTPTPTSPPRPTPTPTPVPAPPAPEAPPSAPVNPEQPVAPEAPPAPQPEPSPGVAPVATTDLPGQMQLTAGAPALTFSVTYAAPDAGLDFGTLDAGDVRVLGRRGFDQPAELVAVQPVDGGAAAVATYAVSQPDGGAWDRTDRGRYTLVTNPDEVRDAAGAAVESAELAEFQLTVAKAPPPDKAPTVRKLKFASRGAAAVTVTFREDVSATIDAGDLQVLAEDGARVDPSLMAVTYDPEKHAATWTFPGHADAALPKGRYKLVLAGAGIADPAGQMLDGDKDGELGDDHAPAKWFRV